jgi:exonuclease III
MRVVTWNMGYWQHPQQHDEAWRWLLDRLDPDIALLQECVPPDWARERCTVFHDRAYPWNKQLWGTALVTRLPAKPAALVDAEQWFAKVPDQEPGKEGNVGISRVPGWCATAEVDLPGVGPTFVMSVHSPYYHIEPSRLVGVDVSDIKLEQCDYVWLLDVVFHFLRRQLHRPLLVGGDFNYSRLLDKEDGQKGNAEFFDRIRDEGFVSLHRLFHDRDHQTFFQKDRAPHQLDYLYADASVGALARSCEVYDHGEVAKFTDHAPVVAELGGDACGSQVDADVAAGACV